MRADEQVLDVVAFVCYLKFFRIAHGVAGGFDVASKILQSL